MIVFCCVLPASNKARDDDDSQFYTVHTLSIYTVSFKIPDPER